MLTSVPKRTVPVKPPNVPTRHLPILPIAGALVGLLANLVGQRVQPGTVDWRTFWTAGHALLSGDNPYQAVSALGTGYPLYYPGPAVLLLAPFGLLPIRLGWACWATCSGAAFGWAAQRYGRGLGVGLLSAAFLEAILFGQWSPLLTAAAVIPALGFLFAAKPSVGLPLFLLRPHRYAVMGGITLSVIACYLLPTWPLDWWAALQHTNHVPPVLRPGGFLLLLAFLKWRTPEGRMLGVLALVPQTTGLYESLPLFLLCRNRWEGYALAVLSYVVAFVQGPLLHGSVEAAAIQRWPLVLGCLYLPALALVLRHPDKQLLERGD